MNFPMYSFRFISFQSIHFIGISYIDIGVFFNFFESKSPLMRESPTNNIILNVFKPEIREHYSLEKIWKNNDLEDEKFGFG